MRTSFPPRFGALVMDKEQVKATLGEQQHKHLDEALKTVQKPIPMSRATSLSMDQRRQLDEYNAPNLPDAIAMLDQLGLDVHVSAKVANDTGAQMKVVDFKLQQGGRSIAETQIAARELEPDSLVNFLINSLTSFLRNLARVARQIEAASPRREADAKR